MKVLVVAAYNRRMALIGYELAEDSEDKRLLRLGIHPDADPLFILLELKKRIATIDTERAKRQIGKAES